MNTPVIALTPQYNDDNSKMSSPRRYTRALEGCGAYCVILPSPCDESAESMKAAAEFYADRFDGFLFTGGDDVDPALFGEEVDPKCGFITRYRDDFEIALLHAVIARKKPVFGICRGIQVINVGLGGTLYQHIDGHSGTFHYIDVESGSPLEGILGDTRLETNSYHHQSVKRCADTLKIAAHADDGCVEAVWAPDYPYLTATQWHPEIMNNDAMRAYSEKLLGNFAAAARAAMKVR